MLLVVDIRGHGDANIHTLSHKDLTIAVYRRKPAHDESLYNRNKVTFDHRVETPRQYPSWGDNVGSSPCHRSTGMISWWRLALPALERKV